MTTPTPPLGPKARMGQGVAQPRSDPRVRKHSGRAGKRGRAWQGRSRYHCSVRNHHVHEAAGAPIPSRCNTRAIGHQLERLLEQGVVVDVHVGSTNPPARCDIRATEVQQVYPIELNVAIEGHVGCTKPQAQCKRLAIDLANSNAVAGVLRRVPRQEGSGPVVAL